MILLTNVVQRADCTRRMVRVPSILAETPHSEEAHDLAQNDIPVSGSKPPQWIRAD